MNILAVTGASFFAVLLQSCGTSDKPVFNTKPPEQECRENMMKLDGSAEQYALEFKKPAGTTVTAQMMVDHEYLKRVPVCPSGGKYNIFEVGKSPSCTIHGKLGDW